MTNPTNTLATTAKTPLVYLVRSGRSNLYKVGTTVDLKRRLENLQSGNPFPLTVIKAWPVSDGETSEGQLHDLLNRFHFNLEWFKLPKQVMTELKAIEDLDQYLAA